MTGEEKNINLEGNHNEWNPDANTDFANLLDDDLLNDGVWVESIDNLRKHKQPVTLRTKVLWYLVLILAIISGLIYAVYYFFYLTLQPQASLNEYQKRYLSFVKQHIISLVTAVDSTRSIESYISFKKPLKKEIDLKQVFSDKSVLFYTKLAMKEQLNKQIYSKLNKFLSEKKKYQNLLIKYKYYSQELEWIVKEIKILPILLSLNSIKVYITDYVFIKSWLFDKKIWSFVYPRSSFAWNYTAISSLELEQKVIDTLIKLRDTGVAIYLKNIYFNYMYSSDDILANSYFINEFKIRFEKVFDSDYRWFSTYYPHVSKEDFITSYVMLIKSIYDRTLSLYNSADNEFMPVDVQLISYNPNTEQLSFTVKLMLSSEIATKVDPVNLMSNIVTLLRESRLIIWKDIKYDGMKVNQVTKMVWWYKIVYKTTEKKFISSVQSPVNVEVTDQK